MAYNLFIAYDLNDPGQNYPAVCNAIESLGRYAKIQLSLYYLRTDYDPATVQSVVRRAMDHNDKLAVIVAADAFITNYPPRDF